MKHILITGATGFIGRNYLYALLKENVKITVVSRTKSVNKTKVLFPEVNVIALDLEIGNLETLNLKALDSVTEVVHIAGGYDIQMDFKDAYKNNILLGQNLIRIIKKLNNIEMVHLISSFSVVGNENNKNFQEDDLCIDERMMNNYSFSKAKAEELFRNSAKELNFRLRIYRPGIVIESRVGKVMDKIDGPYYFSSELLKYKKIIRSMLFLTIPFSKKARLPLVSIECLTKNLVYATLKPSKDHQIRCYYFFSDNQVSVDKLLNAFFKILGIKTKVFSLPKLNSLKRITNIIGIPDELFDFMFMNNAYETSHRENDLPFWEDEAHDSFELAQKVLSSTPNRKWEITNA